MTQAVLDQAPHHARLHRQAWKMGLTCTLAAPIFFTGDSTGYRSFFHVHRSGLLVQAACPYCLQREARFLFEGRV